MTLSSLIVQREVATMRQVEEALARQVIYGGDLATNLMEVAAIDEGELTRLLAEAARIAPAPPGELPIAPEPAQLVSPEVATTRGIVPLTLEGEILVLAVIEPMTDEIEEQLMFALGLAIEQRAASAVRVRQAIARLYGLPLERRMQRLVARLSGFPAPPGSTPMPFSSSPSTAASASPSSSHSPAPAPASAPASVPALAPSTTPSLPHSSSRSLSHSPSPAQGVALPPPGAGHPPPRKSAKTPPLGSPVARISLGSERVVPVAAPVAPAGGRRRQTSPEFPAAVASGAHGASRSSPPSAPELPAGLLQRDVPSGMRSSRRRRGPITMEAAKREADEAADRDALLDLFFDFSRQFFDFTALFLVHGDIAEGRDAFGEGVSRERLVGIGVPLDLPSLLSRTRDERAAVVAKPSADGLDAVLLADLQRPRDTELAVVPLVVRTRTVALLLGDCGDAGIEREGMEQVAPFAALIGKALARIIVRRKLEGFIATGRPSDPGAFVDAGPDRTPSSAPPSPRGEPVATLVPAATMPPPPPNVVTVRKVTGPPIPREEPEDTTQAVSESDGRGAEDAGLAEATDESGVERRIPEQLDARALFDMLGWESATEDPEVAPPSSALAVPPHLPPLGYTAPNEELPSVIVDLEQELGEMVDRVLGGDADESAEAELLRQGERAMRVIMSRFPGPVTVERGHIVQASPPPRPSECGPLLRLIARERKVALPFVLERLDDPDPETRGWATYILSELPYAEAIPHLIGRLRDPDPSTRASALYAIGAVAKAFPEPTREAITRLASSEDGSDRASALRAMAELRQPGLVPDFVEALGDRDGRVVAAAHDALVQVTRQDLGNDGRPWQKWWEGNASRHRIEWLIDALTHDVSEIRRAAGDELRTVTREYFGYSSDLPSRDRDRAQQRYRDWWITEGRSRFRRR
jgi:Type II secretion system (T2SS), protein E, N-terminal domain/HEAT repeats